MAEAAAARMRELRERAERDLRALVASLDAVRAARTDPAGADDEHDPEGATLADEWSRLEGLRRQAEQELAELDAASARVDEGTYGICAGCARPIPAARLRARPTATLCVTCAERRR
jgi:DnaK suppressor protein